jgi:hypothetical protein
MKQRTHVGTVPILRYDDVCTVDGGYRQSFGTISGYCEQYNESDEVIRERIERATKLGHNYAWFNAQATIISNPPTIPDEIKWQLSANDLVFVDSIWPEERGYWLAYAMSRNSGDNCSLSRPDAVFECWSEKDRMVILLEHQLPSWVATMAQDAKRNHLHVIRHEPNEYTLSGFSEDVS